MRRTLLALILGAGCLALIGTAHAAAPAQDQPAAVPAGCPGNLLVNPNFDGGSRKTEGEGTSLSSAVSDGWSPWLLRGDETNNREPEYKVEQVAIGGDPYRTRSGGQSMKWFTTWGTHTAGIYQRVPVRPGSNVEFSIYSMTYSGEADGWNAEKKTFLTDPEKPGYYAVAVGIDPTGATPAGVGAPPPASVIWSEPSLQPDDWVRQVIQAKAQGGAVTVYTKGQPQWAVKHNDSWWEDACLRVIGAPAVKAAVKAVPKSAKSAPAPAVKAKAIKAKPVGKGAATWN